MWTPLIRRTAKDYSYEWHVVNAYYVIPMVSLCGWEFNTGLRYSRALELMRFLHRLGPRTTALPLIL